jgi:hypothetical protein
MPPFSLRNRPSWRPAPVRFGRRENKLFSYLLEACRSPQWARGRMEVLAHVYGIYDLAEAAAGGYFASLRQLQRAVNRKLRDGGDPRKIISPYHKYLALIDSTTTNRPKRPGEKKKAARRRRPARRRGLSVRECAALLREELAKGNNRSSDLERLCIQERGGSRRAFFQARKREGLRAVLCREGDRCHWILVPPPASHLTD